jgi:hypothetical protein
LKASGAPVSLRNGARFCCSMIRLPSSPCHKPSRGPPVAESVARIGAASMTSASCWRPPVPESAALTLSMVRPPYSSSVSAMLPSARPGSLVKSMSRSASILPALY